MCPRTPEDATAVKRARDFRCIPGSAVVYWTVLSDVGRGKEIPDKRRVEGKGCSLSGRILRYIKSLPVDTFISIVDISNFENNLIQAILVPSQSHPRILSP